MKKPFLTGLLSLTLLSSMPYAVYATEATTWKNVNVFETQEQSGSLFNSENYAFVKYSQIASQLQSIAKQSNRVTVEVKGKSAAGRDMYVVTISDPASKGKYGYYQGLRKKMLKSPEKAQEFVDAHPDFKTPVMINASIHGTEFVGTDAVLNLIERFALENDEVTQNILANNILIFNVVANPDGRVDATRFNSNGIDLNRDFITQSQPETQQMVDLITEWNPMVFLDMHGYVRDYGGPGRPGLIEPCTPPHNPNYEYDLFSKWAMDQAKAMEAEIVAQQPAYTGALYSNMQGVYIPQRDDAAGWDDYPLIFTPMYAMYHGAFGYTMEAPTNDLDGVRWQYDATIGALKFASEHKADMIKDQIEIFKRGVNFDHPFHEEGFFPTAYVLPVNPLDPTVTQKAVNHLLNNDIQVEQAQKAFTLNGQTYPAGTYIVPMDQAKAGLANTMLWDGEDISNDTTAMYDISAWSLPELWGFEAVAAQETLDVHTTTVNQVNTSGSLVGKGPYKIPNTSVQAVHLANELLQQGVKIQRDAEGDFYVEAQAGQVLKEAVKASGLTLQTVSVPASVEELHQLNIAVLKDGGLSKQRSHSGTKLALERLGFQITELTPQQVAVNGLNGYDVFINGGREQLISTTTSLANKEFVLQSSDQVKAFKENVNAFVSGGGKYISVGAGAAYATKALGLTNVNVNIGGANHNGIVKVNYGESALTAGYKAQDIGFVYRPAWFTNTTGTNVAATYANTPDFFLAGFWKNSAAAEGQAVIVQEQSKDVTLIGLEAGFRDHTDYLFRLLSNAVYE